MHYVICDLKRRSTTGQNYCSVSPFHSHLVLSQHLSTQPPSVHLRPTPLLRARLGHIQTTPTINPNTPNHPFLPFQTLMSCIPHSPMTQPTLITNPSLVKASLIRPRRTINVPPHNNRDHGDLGRHHHLNNSNNPFTTTSRISVIKMMLPVEAYPTSVSTSM